MAEISSRSKLISLLRRGTLILGVCPGIYWLTSSSPADSDAVAVSASDSIEAAVSEDAELCQLKLESHTIDFGRVFEGTKNRYSLSVTNASDEPVEVTSARATCGCTKVLTKTPFVVPPRQSRQLEVQMDTSRRTGPLTKTVNVFVSDRGAKFKLPVDVSAEARPLISVSTRRIEFGMLRPDQTEQREINITLHDTDNKQAASGVQILQCPEHISAVVSDAAMSEQGERRVTVTVAVDGRKIPEESINEDLLLKTPSTVDGVLRIPVSAAQFSWVRSEPARIDFGVVRKPDDAVQTLRLEAVENHSWTIESVTLEDAPEYLTAERTNQGQVRLQLNTVTASKGFFNGMLKVRYRCDEGQRQSIVVPITGYRFTDG